MVHIEECVEAQDTTSISKKRLSSRSSGSSHVCQGLNEDFDGSATMQRLDSPVEAVIESSQTACVDDGFRNIVESTNTTSTDSTASTTPLNDPPTVSSAKDLGNQAFKNGNIEEALEHWCRGVRSCQYILSKDAYEGAKKKDIEDLLNVLNLNLAAGFLKSKKFHSCIEKCDAVLKYTPDSSKALFRKADALFQLGRYAEGLESLALLLASDPSNIAARRLHSQGLRDSRAARLKEQKMMKKLFSTIEADPRGRNTTPSFWSNSTQQFARFFSVTASSLVNVVPLLRLAAREACVFVQAVSADLGRMVCPRRKS